MECSRRQKVMTPDGVQLRCLNRKCPAWGQDVNDEACGMCEFREYKKTTCKEARAASEMTPAEKEFIGKYNEEDEVVEKTPDGAPPPEYPKWSIQAWLYTRALVKWNKAGCPTRSQEEVEEIEEKHCKRCDWYDPEQRRCKGCGCKVTDGAVAVTNKIKMATEHCPKELW